MSKMIKLAITDFKIIFRDFSLMSFFLLPFLLFALVIWAIPSLLAKYAFLVPYTPLFLVVGVIENTQMFSFISSMVLIDEKETDVAKVYGVVPITKQEFIFSRFVIPYLVTVLLNVVMFRVQSIAVVSFASGLSISCLAALVVPVYVLAINASVQNRLQGMVYIKAFNMLVLVPLAAFFVPDTFRYLFGMFPTHWIFQAIDQVSRGESATITLLVGFVYWLILLWVTSKWFIRKHFV